MSGAVKKHNNDKRLKNEEKASAANLAEANKLIAAQQSQEAARLQNQMVNFRPAITPEMMQAMQSKASPAPMPQSGNMSMDYLKSIGGVPQYGRVADQQWQQNRTDTKAQIANQSQSAQAMNDWLQQQTNGVNDIAVSLKNKDRRFASADLLNQVKNPNFFAQFSPPAKTNEQQMLLAQQLRGGLLKG